MSSEARIAADVTAAADVAAAGIEQVLLAEKCTITQKSPDGLALNFTTRKTMLSWELEGAIRVSPASQGSRIELALNTHHNRPAAVMDKMKNDKSAKKLMEKITAAV